MNRKSRQEYFDSRTHGRGWPHPRPIRQISSPPGGGCIDGAFEGEFNTSLSCVTSEVLSLMLLARKRKHGVETCRPRRRGSLKFSICEKRSSQCALFITAKTSVRKWRFFPTTLIIGHKIDGGHLSSFSNTPSAREAIAIHCPCHCPFLDHLPTYRLPSSPLPTVFLQPCGDFGCCGLCGCTRTLL